MKCTHVALQVQDIEKSIAFYERYCKMKPVHHRNSDGTRVAWMGWGEDPPKFVVVLIEQAYDQNVQPPWQHVGMSVASRAEVDRLFQMASEDNIANLWPPVDAGPIVGYYCGVPDPDGNLIEFSYGQRIG